MAKKGITIWLFSSLTFIALLHLIDAIYAITSNTPIKLLQLYPIPNDKLQTITPTIYFWITTAATLILWGITCTIAFENPVETFLNKILSDAKTQSATENQILENKSEILDAMYETIESSNTTLAAIKDMVCNVRGDVKEMQPLKENVEKIKTELTQLKKELKKVEEKIHFQIFCPDCKKPLLPEFKICPYCGKDVNLLTRKVAIKEYR
ncbi:MAG: zinc ribbon domain-containing protein [Candidatus Bathyarchaeia archaeon]